MEFRRKNLMPVGYTDGFSRNELYADTFNQCMDKGMAMQDYQRKYREYQNQTKERRRAQEVRAYEEARRRQISGSMQPFLCDTVTSGGSVICFFGPPVPVDGFPILRYHSSW